MTLARTMWAASVCLAACLELAQGIALASPDDMQSMRMERGPETSIGPALSKMALAGDTVEHRSPSPKELSRQKVGQFLVHELRELGSVDGIPVLTVETRIEKKRFMLPGAPGYVADNLGLDQSWEGHRAQTKNKKYQEYINAHMDTPDKLVVMVDGGDVIWGGCDGSVLRSTYESTVKASGGAKIVLGAEFGCGPRTMMRVCFDRMHLKEPFESMRRSVLKELGNAVVNRSSNAQWLNESEAGFEHKFVDDMYAERTICNREGMFCSTPPRYEFANYGFVMGPVGALKPLIDEVNRRQDASQKTFDQGVVLKYHADHPKQVTLDYSGTLMLSLHNFLGDVSGEIPDFLSIDKQKRKVFNTLTGRQQCFLHGNGRAKPLINAIALEFQDPWMKSHYGEQRMP